MHVRCDTDCASTRNVPGDATPDELFDPTLASCCQREQLQQEKIAEVKAALLSVDRIDERLRVARDVVESKPCTVAQHPSLVSSSTLQTESEDEEDDYLSQLRSARLTELQQVLKPGRCWAVVDIPSSEPIVNNARQDGMHLVHVRCKGSTVAEEMDEHLDSLAAACPNTQIWRRTYEDERRSCHPLPCGEPGLLHIKDGALVGYAVDMQFSREGTLLQEKADAWLKRRGVLKSTFDVDSSSDSDAEAADNSEWLDPCDKCGRRYYHQHIDWTAPS